MPIYDYHCPECHKTAEKLVKAASTLVECQNCGSKMERLVSGSQSFYFKGSGVYCEKSMNPRKTSS
jgi:putative FmdB family regulatory protein